MMVVFSLVLALTLLVGFIYLLRQHHQRIRQAVVAREQPLPPLSSDNSQPIIGQPGKNLTPAPNGSASRSSPSPDISPAAMQPPATATAIDKGDWLQACQWFRDRGDYDAALATCHQAWPQWQSFEQAARVIRAAIRNTPRSSTEYQLWLARLYQLAAQASFLYDKVAGLPEPNRRLLAKRFDRALIEQLEMPWQEIGYRELRLLTKSDCKHLLQMLGEPKTHQSARVFHDEQWLKSNS